MRRNSTTGIPSSKTSSSKLFSSLPGSTCCSIELVSVYTRNLELNTVSTTTFLYHYVVLSEDIFFRRNILVRFVTCFNDEKYSWQHKCCFIRYVVTPTLLVQASRASNNDRIIDMDFVAQLHRLIWIHQKAFPESMTPSELNFFTSPPP